MPRPSFVRRAVAGLCALSAGLVGGGTAGAAHSGGDAGSPGAGDPYFPEYGNGGYDARHYEVSVRFNPGNEHLNGRTVITMVPDVRLTRFNLDFVLPVSDVFVNGAPAQFRQTDHELVVTPRAALRAGRSASVAVRYGGVPSDVTVDGINPWITTSDGAVALGEPEIAAWWFPSNDHPIDKATFGINLNVPAGTEAISNGRYRGRTTDDGWSRWRWTLGKPAATYLIFAAIGQYRIQSGTASGLPYLNAIGTEVDTPAVRDAMSYTARATRYLERQWGPYPYGRVGGVVPNDEGNFYYALETQTRPVYDAIFFTEPNRSVVIHEMAHQWFGNSVSVERWGNIWLNEGFATYSEWIWAAATGEGPTPYQHLQQAYDSAPANDPFWDVRIGSPGPGSLFDNAVYDRGAMTAQALRNRVGKGDFFRIMRTWVRENAGGNVSSKDFRTLAEEISGEDLEGFFQAWLFTGAKPERTAENGL